MTNSADPDQLAFSFWHAMFSKRRVKDMDSRNNGSSRVGREVL